MLSRPVDGRRTWRQVEVDLAGVVPEEQAENRVDGSAGKELQAMGVHESVDRQVCPIPTRDAVQPCQPLRGRHDPQHMPGAPSRQGALVDGEAGTDRRCMLGRLVDLQAEDRRSVAELSYDDAVRTDVSGQDAVGHRFGQPQLNDAWRRGDQGADSVDDVKAVADATDAASPGVDVSEALAAASSDPVRDGDAAAFRRERSSFQETELPEAPEPAQGGASARVDEGAQLSGGGDAGAVEQAEAGAIASRQQPDVETGHERSFRGLAEYDAHGRSPADRAAMRERGVSILPEVPLDNACVPSLSVSENLTLREFDVPPILRAGSFISKKALRERAALLISRYRVKCASPEVRIRELSGGNVQRAVLARELSSRPEVLIAQNPCFGLDVGAASEIRSQIVDARNRGAAVLLISEDLDELLELADRIVVMFDGALVYETKSEGARAADIGRHMAGHG